MPETTTSTATTTQNPVMDPVVYWRVSAFALAAVALLGIVLSTTGNADILGKGFLAFDWSHTILHVILAAAAFLFGFAALPARMVKAFALVFGVVYAGLGVLGFVTVELGPMHLEVGENVIHLALGAWGLLAGIAGKA